MTSNFINRNRSQGGYGLPISNQRFPDNTTTWLSRAKGDNNAFLKNSLKYGSNVDRNPNKVPFSWSLNDTCDIVKNKNYETQTQSNTK